MFIIVLESKNYLYLCIVLDLNKHVKSTSMKKIKFLALFLSAALVFGSCGTSNTVSHGAPAGSGAALGISSVLPVKVKVHSLEQQLVRQ